MSNSDNTRLSSARGSSGRNRPLHGLILILSALERGVEIGIDGIYIRLFRAGDVVRLPAGYFKLEEDRILQRMTGAHPASARYPEFVYVDDEMTVNGLMQRAQMLTEEAKARIAAAAQSSQWHAGGNQDPAPQERADTHAHKTAQVLQLFGKNS